jgi:hypothetical protein
MVDIYSRINIEIKKRQIKLQGGLINHMGLSVNGYYLIFKNKRLSVEHIEKISEYMGVEPYYWFLPENYYNNIGNVSILNEPNFNYNKCKSCEEKQQVIEALKKTIEADEKTIKAKDELCEALMRERNELIKQISTINQESKIEKR